MYKLFLSVRYFRSRLINIIPVICMMLGVTALIVILAVMDGFQAQLRATLRGALSDMIIRVDYESDFEKWEKVLAETEHVRAWAPHLETFAIVAQVEAQPDRMWGPAVAIRPASRVEPKMEGALVIGIDPDLEVEVSSFGEYLRHRVGGAPPEEWPSSTLSEEEPFEVFDQGLWAPLFLEDEEETPDLELQRVSGVILGRHLAGRLGVDRPVLTADGEYRYSQVCLTTATRDETGAGGAGESSDPGSRRKQEFSAQQILCAVTGIYESGNQEIDQRIAFMDRRVAKKIFQIRRDPQEIRLALDDYGAHRNRVKRDLYARAQQIFRDTRTDEMRQVRVPDRPFLVESWEDRRRNFLNAIENEKGLIAIIAGMAFVVTGFMIFSILSMIVTMKTRDIGILKALGATTRGVLWIFILNGLLVGVIGASLGLAGGVLFTDNINSIKEQLNVWFGWEPFPQNIYLFSEIPTVVVAGEVAVVTGLALLVALLGAVLPALRAARMDPVESLRYE